MSRLGNGASMVVTPSPTGQTEYGYLPHAGEQLYYVLERPKDVPRARVLLAGPFANERPHRYMYWARWGRYLAGCGYEVLRFDHRGVGESTGVFQEMGVDAWLDDLRLGARWLADRGGDASLALHGLGLGALLVSQIFDEGIGDACLLWQPPESGRQMLYEQLRLRLANDFSLGLKPPKSRDAYVSDLEAGGTVEVEGYNWTRRLWRELSPLKISEIPPPPDAAGRPRPRHTEALDAVAAHMFAGVGPSPIRIPGQHSLRLVSPDLGPCFSASAAWLERALGLAQTTELAS